MLDQRSFWMIYNTQFPLCLSNETMIHSVFYHLVWLLFGKCYIPWKCRTKSQILLKQFYFPLHFHHVCHHRLRHTTGISHYVFNMHMTGYCWRSKLLLHFCFSHPIQMICSVCHYLTILLFCTAHKGFQPLCIKVSNKSGHVVCYCVTWPLPVIKVPYCRYHFVFESSIQADDTYLNQSPSCFAAMKLSPGKVQTEKVKPRSMTSTRI